MRADTPLHIMATWDSASPNQHEYRLARAIWLAVASAAITTIIMTFSATQVDTRRLSPQFHVWLTLATNVVLYELLYLYNFGIIKAGLKRGALVASGVVGSIAIATLASVGFFNLEWVMYGTHFVTLASAIVINIAAALIAYLISLLITNVYVSQQALLENERLQSENLRIRYETLKQQVSPHYFFNTLGGLDALIGTDDEAAHRYLVQLAQTVRYTLGQRKSVPLAEEMQFTQSYIYLMQTRHGEALQFDIEIPEQLQSYTLPAISLQLLVENAIKHNVVSQRHPLRVSIVGSVEQAQITVSNPLQPKVGSENPSGIGLQNLDNRYALLYEQHITIRQTPEAFVVSLPLIKEPIHNNT